MRRGQVEKEAAVQGRACPTCHRAAGHACSDTAGRVVTAHPARVDLARSDARWTERCPAISPGGDLCDLPDLPVWHVHGHHSFSRALASRVWSPSVADQLRWRDFGDVSG
jgi:hypothetical protein